jgi:hypothetical protein
MESMHPVDEENYEIILDCHGSRDGPKNGRLSALNNVNFFLSTLFLKHDYELVVYLCSLLFFSFLFLIASLKSPGLIVSFAGTETFQWLKFLFCWRFCGWLQRRSPESGYCGRRYTFEERGRIGGTKT